MGGAASFISPVVQTGLGMMSQYREVKASNDAAEYNARGFEAQAQSARTRGAFDLSLLQREHHQNLAKTAQGLSNSGVQLTSGSALQMLSEQRGLDERAQQVQKYSTELEAYGYQQKADMARSQKRSAWGSMMGTLVSGIGGISQNFASYQATSPCGLGSSRCGYP